MYFLKKFDNFYILYYILLLIKNILLIYYYNKFKYNYFLYIYIYFFIIYIKYYYYFNYNNNMFFYNYIYFYIYKYNNNFIKYKKKYKNYNLIEKIIKIQKISYTIKKGRIKRYKIILLIGNKQGWIGIGIGKNINISKAIFFARLNAFNNIYYFKYSLLNMYKLKYILINIKQINLKLQFCIFNFLNIKFLLIKYLFECLGYYNCKVIIFYNSINNKINLLYKLLLLLFNVFFIN